MKKLQRILSIALVVGLTAPAALAAVNGSHHDLQLWSGGSTKETCFYCHGAVDTAAVSGYGEVGALCVNRCHKGAAGYAGSAAAIPNRPATATEAGAYTSPAALLTAITANAHGLTKTDLWSAATGTTNVTFSTQGQGFPYGSGAQALQCTSCHNVHDKTNTPFLQANLFTGGPTGRSFCEACHYNDRGNNWAAAEVAPNGDHPVNFTLVTGNVTSRTLGGRKGRYIQIDTFGGSQVFAVTTNTVLSTSTQNYVTGGHLSSWAQTGTFGCYTCHSVHMDSGSGNANLVLRNTVNTTATPVAVGTWNPLCVSCHGPLAAGADHVEQNPGLSTSAFYHPTGPNANTGTVKAGNVITYSASTGAFTFAVDMNNVVLRNTTLVGNLGTNGIGVETTSYKPRCTSCHDPHGGVAGTMAVADLDGTINGSMTGAVCYRCHSGGGVEGLPDVRDDDGQAGEPANSHHRTGSANYTASASYTDIDGDILTMDSPSWAGTTLATGDTFGNLADGLQCPDCHVFNGTAHNW